MEIGVYNPHPPPPHLVHNNLRQFLPDSFLGAEASGEEKLGNQLNADHSKRFNFRLSIKANEQTTVKIDREANSYIARVSGAFCVSAIVTDRGDSISKL